MTHFVRQGRSGVFVESLSLMNERVILLLNSIMLTFLWKHLQNSFELEKITSGKYVTDFPLFGQ